MIISVYIILVYCEILLMTKMTSITVLLFIITLITIFMSPMLSFIT